MNDTTKKAIIGIKWTTIQTVIVGILGPLSIVIQARYLSPKEMGYVAIIMIVIGLLSVIENMGMSQAIIQNKNFNNRVFTSLFTVNIILSILISVVLFYIAPLLENVFNLEGLSYYLRLIIILVIIQSPSLILRAVLQKELLIKALSIIEILKISVQIITLIIMLLLGYGVLSVVFSAIFGTFLATICLFYYMFKIKIVRFSRFESLKELLPYLKFGSIISVKQIFTAIVLKADEILIGLMLSSDVLGLYHFGKNVLEKFRTLLTSTFSRILFPYFSKLQNNLKELNVVYNKVTKVLALIAFPTFTGIALTAQFFIPIIFGEEWLESLTIFRIISIGLIPMLLTFSVATFLLYSVNRPGVVLKVDIITNTIYLLVLFTVAHLGIIVVAFTYVLFILAKSIYLQIHVNDALKGSYKQYLSNLKKPFINTLIMTIVLIAFYIVVPDLNNIIMLTMSIIIGVLCYTLLIRNTNKELYEQVISKIKK